jgi:hypothetical protein
LICLAAFVVLPILNRLVNVFLLAFFSSTTQQQNDSDTILGQINSKSLPPVNSILTYAAKPLNIG